MAMGEPRKEKYRVHCSMLGEFHCICILYLPPTESLQCHSDCPDGGAIAPTGVHTPEGGVRLPRWRWGSPEGRGTESTVQRLWANSIAFVYYTLPPTGSFQCPSDCPDGGGPRIGYTYAGEIPICNWGLDARNLYPSLRGSPIAIGAATATTQLCVTCSYSYN